MNILTPEKIKWEMSCSLNMGKTHFLKHVDKNYKLERESITKRKGQMDFYKSKVYYFITGQKEEYKDLQSLCDAYNQLKIK